MFKRGRVVSLPPESAILTPQRASVAQGREQPVSNRPIRVRVLAGALKIGD